MKILHLTSSSGLYGADNIILTLAQDCNNKGITSIVGTFNEQRHSDLEIILKAKSLGIPTFILECKGRFDRTTIKELTHFLRNENIDILHTHNYKSNLLGMLAAKKAGTKIVSTVHGYTKMTALVYLYEMIDRFIIRNFMDKFVIVSKQQQKLFPPGKQRYIPNGIKTMKFDHNKTHCIDYYKNYNIQDSNIVIGTVGRLSAEKNQIMLLKAFKAVSGRNKSVKLLFVGDGPQKKHLMEYVKQNKLDETVIFTGFKKDILCYYRIMDIFVLCSKTEGLPLVLLEAMASKIPIIATNVGGISYLLQNGVSGYLINSGNVAELITGLEILIHDYGIREQYAENAFQTVHSHYSYTKMCERYHQFYNEVITS